MLTGPCGKWVLLDHTLLYYLSHCFCLCCNSTLIFFNCPLVVLRWSSGVPFAGPCRLCGLGRNWNPLPAYPYNMALLWVHVEMLAEICLASLWYLLCNFINCSCFAANLKRALQTCDCVKDTFEIWLGVEGARKVRAVRGLVGLWTCNFEDLMYFTGEMLL